MSSVFSKKLLSGKKNYVAWNRRAVVFRRHFPVVARPVFASLVIVVGWYLLIYKNGIGFRAADENPLLFIILPLVSFVYVIFASISINSVFDEYKIISKAVVQRDLDTFLLHRDEQLPILLHILVAIPSFILVGLTLLFHYEDPLVGAAAVFAVSFIIITTWIVGTELDNFEKSIWFKESTPKEWLEIDIEEYFREKADKEL